MTEIPGGHLACRLAAIAAVALSLARGAARPPMLPGQSAAGDPKAATAEWSTAQLIRKIPELKRLDPPSSAAESAELLPVILNKVGTNVEAFFRDFPNTTSRERIHTQRLDQEYDEDSRGVTRASSSGLDQNFNYVALARASPRRPGLDEYRTDGKGALVEPGGGLVTKGFASMSIHFHPAFRNDSVFQYLGTENIGKRQTYVVAFAQRPGVARVVGRVVLPDQSVSTLLEGVAWIDAESYQIVRLRTDLLTPVPETGLKQETTEVRYDPVRFKGVASALWLPEEVTVTVDWKGDSFRNRHRYSDFKRFSVETEETQGSPRPVDGAMSRAGHVHSWQR